MIKNHKKFMWVGVSLLAVIVIMGMIILGVYINYQIHKPQEFALDCVTVVIGIEHKGDFLSQSYTIEDFNFDNVERIVYSNWYETTEPPKGEINVYLKKHGESRVREAIEQLSKLDFVESAHKVAYVHAF